MSRLLTATGIALVFIGLLINPIFPLLEITPDKCGITFNVVSQTKVQFGVAGGFCDNQYGDPPFTYDWAFGDGQTSTAPNVTHVYPAAGVYNVVLTISDSRTAHWDTSCGCTVNGPFISTWGAAVDTRSASSESGGNDISGGQTGYVRLILSVAMVAVGAAVIVFGRRF